MQQLHNIIYKTVIYIMCVQKNRIGTHKKVKILCMHKIQVLNLIGS